MPALRKQPPESSDHCSVSVKVWLAGAWPTLLSMLLAGERLVEVGGRSG